MKKLLILFAVFLFATTAFAQGVPGKDNLLWWQTIDSAGVEASLTLNGSTRDTVYFDFRARQGMYKNPMATFTGTFDVWIYCDSLKGDPDMTLRYYPLKVNQEVTVVNIRDWKKIFNERYAFEGFNYNDNTYYGPIKIYAEDCFGLAFAGWCGTSTDTGTVLIKVAIGSGLNTPVSPYSDGVRYLNEYTNSTLRLRGVTDTLNIDIPLGKSEGYTGLQLKTTATASMDSVYISYTPYSMFGTLATNRTTSILAQGSITTELTYDWSLTALPPTDMVRVTLWNTGAADTLTIGVFEGCVRYKMGSGK